MASIKKNQSGMTLVELLVTFLLLSGVLLCASTLYINSMRFFQGSSSQVNLLYARLAMEHIARHLSLADKIEIMGVAPVFPEHPDPANPFEVIPAMLAPAFQFGTELKMRWDRQLDGSPNLDPVTNQPIGISDTSQHTWVKYLIADDGKLYWQVDATEDGDVVIAPQNELQPGLSIVVDGTASYFGSIINNLHSFVGTEAGALLLINVGNHTVPLFKLVSCNAAANIN